MKQRTKIDRDTESQNENKTRTPLRLAIPALRAPWTDLHDQMGNRAVGQLVQAKLTIGAPDDKYEQEADRVAEQVMRMPEPSVQRTPT